MADKLQAYERILVATGRINVMVAQLIYLRSDLMNVQEVTKDDALSERINGIENVLQNTSAEVIELLGNISDFMNGIDAVTEQDVELFGKIHDALYAVADAKCESCELKHDMDLMSTDDAGNWFCPSCYEELAPVMKKEYDDMVARGEIDPERD